MTTAFGFAVAPTYDAVYLYDPPGSHVRTHVDTRDYELVFHLILEHALPRRRLSGLGARRPPARASRSRRDCRSARARPWRSRGRGTIHSWEPLREDEDRIMIAIGFASAP